MCMNQINNNRYLQCSLLVVIRQCLCLLHCFYIGHIFECRQRSCDSIDCDLLQFLTSDMCTWYRIGPQVQILVGHQI